ncbi:MAG: amidohydrolase family protein [Spirochaetes bacterium]|nr:amidohydrolase family protein [Spirochaetota bacterium]
MNKKNKTLSTLFMFLLFTGVFNLFSAENSNHKKCKHKIYDLIIENGTIIDGTGADRYIADLAIKKGRIVKIGNLAKALAWQRIDASGLVVAPGFIESHSNDRPETLVGNPYALSMLHQGVTSLIMGEQGFAPSDYLSENGYSSIRDGFKLLKKNGIVLNYGTYVDQGDIRATVMGLTDTGKPTEEQLAEMKKLVKEAMEAGAFGLSSALVYAPGSFSDTETIIELAKVAASYGGSYKTHVRGEDQYTLQEGRGIYEALTIGQEAGIPVIINHMKTPGIASYEDGTMGKIIAFIADARNNGHQISAQMYPYQYGVTSLHLLLPPWQQAGTNAEIVARLQDPDTRAVIRQEIYEEIQTEPFFNFLMVTSGGNWEKIKLVSAITDFGSEYTNMDFYQIAEAMGYDIVANPQDAIEAYFDLVISEYSDSSTGSGTNGPQPKVVLPAYYAVEDLELGLSQDWVGIACDGLLQKPEDAKIHPRCFGSYPKVLGYFTRERELFTLEAAVRKMTGLIADQLNMKKRGKLLKKYAADITIFDPETIDDLATYANPNVYPAGIQYVIVNGKIVLENDTLTGCLPGKILKLNKK